MVYWLQRKWSRERLFRGLNKRTTASVSGSRTSTRSDLQRLHRGHAHARFSRRVSPPNDRGITCSTWKVAPCSESCMRQYSHRSAAIGDLSVHFDRRKSHFGLRPSSCRASARTNDSASPSSTNASRSASSSVERRPSVFRSMRTCMRWSAFGGSFRSLTDFTQSSGAEMTDIGFSLEYTCSTQSHFHNYTICDGSIHSGSGVPKTGNLETSIRSNGKSRYSRVFAFRNFALKSPASHRRRNRDRPAPPTLDSHPSAGPSPSSDESSCIVPRGTAQRAVVLKLLKVIPCPIQNRSS